MPDALAPYASLIKWGLIVGLLVGVFVYGRSEGKQSQAKTDAALIAQKDRALHAASRSFAAFAGTFRAIDKIGKQNVAQAKALQERGRTLAQQAERERIAAAAAWTDLERKLKAERTGCVDGNRPICGIPLR